MKEIKLCKGKKATRTYASLSEGKKNKDVKQKGITFNRITARDGRPGRYTNKTSLAA